MLKYILFIIIYLIRICDNFYEGNILSYKILEKAYNNIIVLLNKINYIINT